MEHDSAAPNPTNRTPNVFRELRLVRIRLENIRCFRELEIELPAGTTLLLMLGENATGKSTLLRSISLGLASIRDASALLTQMPGGLVGPWADRGMIELELSDGRWDRMSIRTELISEKEVESVQRLTTDLDGIDRQDLFVCAYGTGRTQQATSSYSRYSQHQALLPLFDEKTSLQNPELILLRQEPAVRAQLEARLLDVLMLEDPTYSFTYDLGGAQLHTPWGDRTPNTLSDGYRSTTQWLLDFLSWAIYAGRLRNGDPIGGILILDEIEQHLHPRWQRHILQRLRQQFPGTQIITTTHTPLVAAAAADVEGSVIIRLDADDEGKVQARRVEREEIVGLRADQVLTEVFGLETSRSPASQSSLDRFAELLGKTPRSVEDERELSALRKDLQAGLSDGETELQRKVEAAVQKALDGLLADVEPELLSFEIKRQLKELFDKV